MGRRFESSPQSVPPAVLFSNQFLEALKKDTDTKQHTIFKDYVYSLILADNNNDLAELEAKVRALSPKGTIIKRKMKPYRDYFNRQNAASAKDDIRNLVS